MTYMLVTISLYDGVKWGTPEHEYMDSWNKYRDECDLRMQIYWFVALDVLGGAAGIGPLSRQEQPAGGTGKWFPPFSCMMSMFWKDLWCNHIIR
jgi:hypothetical protein